MTNEAKLGGFVLIGLVALIVSIMLLGDFQFQSKYSLNILFKDIAGLPSKSRVKIAGVEVGGVRKITLEGNEAKVTIWIRKDIPVHDDAIARIVATGLIGSKYLELTMGSPGRPLLKGGDTIRGIEPISFDKVMSDLMEQLDAFTAPFKGKGMKNIGENLSETLENLKKVSETLKVAIADHEERINDIVKNVDNFTKDLSDITSANKEDVRAAIKEIKSVSEKLDAILVKIQKGEGTLGALISDEQMGKDLKDSVKEIKLTMQEARTVVKRMTVIETEWVPTMRFDTFADLARFDFGLRISPTPNKYYYLGIADMGDNKDVNDPYENRNTIDLQFGWKNDRMDAYIGAIRSKFGAGFRFKPLWKWEPWKRLEITGQAYDFARTHNLDGTVPVTKPRIDTGLRVNLAKWAYLGMEYEDIYYESGFTATANLVVRDDDIAYILGLVGLARP